MASTARFGPEIPEIWKPIAGYEGRYEVSDAGGVRSLDRISSGNHRAPQRRISGKVLSPSRNNLGYLLVGLCDGAGAVKKAYLHHLVAVAFIGPRPDGLDVLHRDDDKGNCRRENLRYGTPTENAADAASNGRKMGRPRQ